MSPAAARHVSVQIQDAEENRMVIDAIRNDNSDLSVRHLPGLVDLTSETQIDIKRETVERLLGRPWETEEFQLALVSYAGNFAEWDDDHILIKWQHGPDSKGRAQ